MPPFGRLPGLRGEESVPAVAGDEARVGARFGDAATVEDDDLVRVAHRGQRPDPADRRATLSGLTAHGASVLDAIRAARGTEAERVFGRLSATDRARLGRILRKLRD